MDPEEKKVLKITYKTELDTLKGMGFSNVTQCLLGLQSCNGNLEGTIDWILSNPMDDEPEEKEEVKPIIVQEPVLLETNVMEEEKWYKLKESPDNVDKTVFSTQVVDDELIVFHSDGNFHWSNY